MWREDSQRQLTLPYRYVDAGSGANTATWNLTGLDDGTTYALYVDWSINNRMTDHGARSPASHALYTVTDRDGPHGFEVDQGAPLDEVPETATAANPIPERWKLLGTAFRPVNGVLTLTLTNALAGGDFVVAGRVRVAPIDKLAEGRVYTRLEPGVYAEQSAPMATVTQSVDVIVADLDAGKVNDALLNALQAPGDAPSFWSVTTRSAGRQWLVIAEPFIDESLSERVIFDRQYLVDAGGAGTLQVTQLWRDIAYRTGQGNFPLWESTFLREHVFRTLFADWQDTTRFPDLGDLPTPDPAAALGHPLQFGTFPTYAAPALTLVPQGGADIVVSGATTRELPGDARITSIFGDGNGAPDSLDLKVEKNLVLAGFIGGSGLKDVTITAGESITIADGTTISTRQVANGANHWNAVSIGDSGNITLIAPVIRIGRDVSLVAHGDATHAAGNVTLQASDKVEQAWSFLGIDDFRWLEAEATIDVGLGGRITGNDIVLTSAATTSKVAALDNDLTLRTRAIATGDIDGDGDSDLVVATDSQGIYQYLNNAGTFGSAKRIDGGLFATTSLALGDVDGDGDIDLVVGNSGQPNRLYLNAGGAIGSGIDFGPARRTSAMALANLDGDAALELVAATDGQGTYLYDFVNGAYAERSIDATALASTSVAVGDVDHDGDIDLVVGNRGQANRLYLNAGGSFAATDFGPALATTGVALGNVDQGLELELVAGTDGGGTWLYSFAGGTFGAPTRIGTDTPSTRTVALGDVDADGDLDVIAGNFGLRSRFYVNNGSGFDAGKEFSAAEPTVALAAVDVDRRAGGARVVGNDHGTHKGD